MMRAIAGRGAAEARLPVNNSSLCRRARKQASQ
jgi:hypothetical protein